MLFCYEFCQSLSYIFSAEIQDASQTIEKVKKRTQNWCFVLSFDNLNKRTEKDMLSWLDTALLVNSIHGEMIFLEINTDQ